MFNLFGYGGFSLRPGANVVEFGASMIRRGSRVRGDRDWSRRSRSNRRKARRS